MSVMDTQITGSLLQSPTSAVRITGTTAAGEGVRRRADLMNRSERIGFWLYLAMTSLSLAIVVAAAAAALVS